MARILIVDDSPSQLLGMKRIVEKLGHEAVTAEDGAQGVEVAKRELPDLILMDVVMPGLNGFQATRAISRDPATRSVPIILCTSKSQETDKIWGMRQGARDYVMKPVSRDELLAKIEIAKQAADLCSGMLDQSIVDEFVSSGEVKWGRVNGLTLMLPHGLGREKTVAVFAQGEHARAAEEALLVHEVAQRLAVAHDDAADRNLAGGLRAACLGKRVIHERLWHKALWLRINTKASASPR